MKVKSVAKALKEHDRLQTLIEKIEKYLKEFAKIGKVEGNVVFISGGYLTFNSSLAENPKEEKVSVTIDGDIADLVRDDVVDLLKTKLVELKKELDKLEL